MKIVPVTPNTFAIVDDDDYGMVIRRRWSLNGKGDRGYPQSWSRGGAKSRTRVLMHRMILNPPADAWVDHLNGNRLDNRRSNLRVCDASQNGANRSKANRRKHTSRFKGVCRDSARNLWAARIEARGKQIYLGRYEQEEDAARAYDNAAKEHFGEFAYLNFQDDQEVA